MSSTTEVQVLLALPCTGELHAQTLGSIQALIHATRRAGGLELCWEDRRPVAACRNRLVERFLANPAKTHLLFVDTDMVVPADGLDRLLETGAPLVCGPAPICRRAIPPGRHEAVFQLATNILDARDPALRGRPVSLEDPSVDYVRREYGSLPAEPFHCDASGLSFCLIAHEVLASVPPPWFEAVSVDGRPGVGEDVYFFRKAAAAGYRLLVQPAAICDHIKPVDLSRFEELLVPQLPEPRWAPRLPAQVPPTLVLAGMRDQWVEMSTAEVLLRWQEDARLRAGVQLTEVESMAWALARWLRHAAAREPRWQRLLCIAPNVVPPPDLLEKLASVDAPIVSALSRTTISGQAVFSFATREAISGELRHPAHLPMSELTGPFETDFVDLACTMLRRDTWEHVPVALDYCVNQPVPDRAFCVRFMELIAAATGRKPVVAPLLVHRRGHIGLLGLLQLQQRLKPQAASVGT